MFKRSIYGISSIAAVLSVPFLAIAPQSGYAQQIEEIVVSVRRKNESLQDVPIAVSVLSEETIKRYGINTTEDVVRYTAGLEFDEGLGAQDTRIVIRGLSPTRGRSNVAVLVDGVDFTGEAIGTAGGGILVSQQLLDLERVEVVKGPQSALYGRSAFAGAISYVTKRPNMEVNEGSLNVEYGYGNDAQGMRIAGAYGGAITDGFGLRVNALAYDQEGFYENSVTNSDIGGSKGYGVALAGLWDKGGMFTANGRVAYSRDEYEPQAQARVQSNTNIDIDQSLAVRNGQSPSLIQTSFFGIPGVGGIGFPDCGAPGQVQELAIQSCNSTPLAQFVGQAPDGDSLTTSQSENPRTGGGYKGTTVDTITATLGLEWDTSVGVFDSYTGFVALDSSQLLDGQTDVIRAGTYTNVNNDYTFTLPDCGFVDCSPSRQEFDFNNETRLFSQELRYSTQWDGPINLTVGGLAWIERVEQTNFSTTISPLISRAPGQLFPDINSVPAANAFIPFVNIPGADVVTRDTDSYSLYGLIDWSLSETLTLGLEGRYVTESLEVSGTGCDVDATIALVGVAPGPPSSGCPQDFRGASSTGISNGPGLGGSLPAGTYTLAVFDTTTASFRNSFFAPKATLTWQQADNQLFYASIAEGVKPGGISTITSGAFFDPDNNTFEKETLLVYELGSKGSYFGGSVVLNGSVFFQDYSDKQVGVTRFDVDIQTDVGAIENAGAAETYGIELETSWLITDNLSVGAAYTWLQSEYTEFTQLTQSGNNVARDLASGGDGCERVIPGVPGNIGTCVVDLAGNNIEDVPEHSFVGNTRWQAPLVGTEMEYFADASFIYKSERYYDEFNAKELDDYWLLDFRAGLTGDNWEAILFIDNVLDDDTVKSGIEFGSITDSNRQGYIPPSPADGIVVSLPDPRIVGVRFNFNFGG